MSQHTFGRVPGIMGATKTQRNSIGDTTSKRVQAEGRSRYSKKPNSEHELDRNALADRVQRGLRIQDKDQKHSTRNTADRAERANRVRSRGRGRIAVEKLSVGFGDLGQERDRCQRVSTDLMGIDDIPSAPACRRQERTYK